MQYGITRHRVFPRNHADPWVLLEYAAKEADGIVIAGAGEFSKEYIQVIEKLTIPVVISSRIDDGIITQNVVLCDNPIAAYHLSAQKAAVFELFTYLCFVILGSSAMPARTFRHIVTDGAVDNFTELCQWMCGELCCTVCVLMHDTYLAYVYKVKIILS